MNKRKDDKAPQEMEEIDIQQEYIENEVIPQPTSKKVYRLVSIVLILSMVFVFVLPPLINSIGFLQMFRGNDLEPKKAQELLAYFEENYLYQELFEQEIYLKKKEELLNRDTISTMRLHLFIKDITNNVGDQYTSFASSTKNSNDKGTTIESRIIDEETYYIKLLAFSKGIAKKMEESLSTSDQPFLILDLRGNPGGSLRELLGIATLFLPEKVEAFRLEGNNSLQSFTTIEENENTFKNIFILLDKKSASASEILALTMKLNMENVVLIGKETARKAVAQIEQKDSNHPYVFSIVSYRWFVQNQSVEDLQDYLLDYKDIGLKKLDDYMDVVNTMIKESNLLH